MLNKKEIKSNIPISSFLDEEFYNVCDVEDLSIIRTKHHINDFPTTRYYGSKKRLLGWIYECIKDLPFKTVLDGFGGTASVSLLMKSMGKDVTFNDALISNAISANALLASNVPFESDEEVDCFFDSVKPENGFIYKKFKGKFYLSKENAWLDGVIRAINSQPESKKNAYLYCLFQACLQKRPFNLFHRANLEIRTNKNVEKTFGNQTTWDTPFPILTKRAYRELKKAVWHSSSHINVMLPTDISEIDSGYDLVYLDPPYISPVDNSDDYQRRYHFLDGLCKYDQWSELIDESYKNLQLKKQLHVCEWQSKSLFTEKLFGLVAKHSSSIVVLSYVDNTYPSICILESFFRKTFKNHEVMFQRLPHALSKGKKKEVLFVGVPK
jgi:adenine-specific DNA-methyltransferase